MLLLLDTLDLTCWQLAACGKLFVTAAISDNRLSPKHVGNNDCVVASAPAIVLLSVKVADEKHREAVDRLSRRLPLVSGTEFPTAAVRGCQYLAATCASCRWRRPWDAAQKILQDVKTLETRLDMLDIREALDTHLQSLQDPLLMLRDALGHCWDLRRQAKSKPCRTHRFFSHAIASAPFNAETCCAVSAFAPYGFILVTGCCLGVDRHPELIQTLHLDFFGCLGARVWSILFAS